MAVGPGGDRVSPSCHRIPILESPAFEIHPVLSPDGRWLAYASDESGVLEVYVTDFPERRRRVKVSTEEAWQPAWNPAREELFYRRRDPDDAMMSVIRNWRAEPRQAPGRVGPSPIRGKLAPA